MGVVKGLERLLYRLNRQLDRFPQENVSVVVGHTQNYALIVHETHKRLPKYLESSLRRNTPEVRRIVYQLVAQGESLEKALLVAGMLIQRGSQEYTPVDTSALKNSAFTCRERDLEQASAAAYIRGEAVRAKVLAERARAAKKRRKNP